jgi:hypothetical protein
MYEFMKTEAGWLVYFGPRPHVEQRNSRDRKQAAPDETPEIELYYGRIRAAERTVLVGDIVF